MKGRAVEAVHHVTLNGLRRRGDRYARQAGKLVLPFLVLLAGVSCADGGGGPDEGAPRTDAVDAASTPGPAVRADSAVRAAARGFSDALAAGDSSAALAFLAPDVLIFEGGHSESLQQYRSGHLAADMAFTASVKRNILAEHVIAARDMALYTSEYNAAGTFRGRSVDTRGTETMVLVPTKGGWKIRHIHWSSS